jgi:hypothetical protein
LVEGFARIRKSIPSGLEGFLETFFLTGLALFFRRALRIVGLAFGLVWRFGSNGFVEKRFDTEFEVG